MKSTIKLWLRAPARLGGAMKIMPDELLLPPRTIMRRGGVSGLLKDCSVFGARGILVHGKSVLVSGVVAKMMAAGVPGQAVKTWQHPGGEPDLLQLESLLAVARDHRAEWIAGVGGGSVIDLAKACAGLLAAPQPAVDYHNGASIPPSRIPLIVAPTTAGTGSEATIVCVLTNHETGVKRSFRHASFMARLVLLDPELLAGSPPPVIAHAGMDAFTQAVESYVSIGSTWFSDQFAIQGLSMIAASLEPVFADSRSEKAADLLMGSYLAGLSLSNARLGIVHGLAHPLGARFHVPHGLACAVCLPYAIEFNREAMGAKYGRLSEAVGGDLLAATNRLLRVFKIASPFAGKTIPDRAKVIEETLTSGSTAANPRKVTAADVDGLLDRMFGERGSE